MLTEFDSHLHQLADADLIQLRERIVLVNLLVVVSVEELACVVTAEAEGHLSQVVRTEAEELSLLRDIVSGKSRSRDLDHRTDFILQVAASAALISASATSTTTFLTNFSSLTSPTSGNHDFGNDVPVRMRLLDVDSRADNRSGLHRCDFGIGDRQTAAAVTHHRVELMERRDDSP